MCPFAHQCKNSHEVIVVHNSESVEAQPTFKPFPDLQVFSSGDLSSLHVADTKLWHYCGRSDDLQVFGSGEKSHLVVLEQQLEESPNLS